MQTFLTRYELILEIKFYLTAIYVRTFDYEEEILNQH